MFKSKRTFLWEVNRSCCSRSIVEFDSLTAFIYEEYHEMISIVKFLDRCKISVYLGSDAYDFSVIQLMLFLK